VNARRRAVVARVVAMIVLTSAAFAVLQRPARTIEARAAAGVLRLAGATRVWHVPPDAIQVVPTGHDPFRAVVTPACSALASMLALAGLASVVPLSARRRRLLAVLAAMGLVAAGNLVRIVASVAVGLLQGRASLVLFHDWAGSAFAFAYVLGGYVLFLFLVLPREVQPRVVVA
jgi:exosortase/archaeosortase family protein